MQSNNSELKLTYSCILSRKKEKIIRITFEREGAYAEGVVPEGKIEKHQGFTKEEVEQLEQYLRQNKTEIFEKAKSITGIRNWFL